MSGGPVFPSNPSTGQLYTYGSTTWVWDGTKWRNATEGQNFLPLVGVTNGSNAPAGQVGEILGASQGTGINFPSGSVGLTVTQVTLTPGDWDADCQCTINAAGGGSFAGGAAWLDTTQSANPVGLPVGSVGSLSVASTLMFNTLMLGSPRYRFNPTVNTTVYLRAYIYTIATPGPFTATGAIYARRMR